MRGSSDLQAARTAYLAGGSDALLPIVDAHHHFWNIERNPHPWLQRTPRIPFRYGDYGAICENFLPQDYARVTGEHRVLRHVVMEGEWLDSDPTGESDWVQRLAAEHGVPHALAAQIWLDRADVADVLAHYKRMPIVRSVRHKPKCAARAAYRPDWAVPGSMRCPRWRDGYARLANAGLMFELQAPWWHAVEAVELARDFPAITMIVNHACLPAERDPESLAQWGAAVESLADCPNIVMKVSGLGVAGTPWTPQLQAPIVARVIASFGVQRCLFASNFPVDGLVAPLETIFSGFKQLTKDLDPSARLALFCDNAVRIYRLT